MNMKMRWKWPWHDKLPNRNTRRGTQKKTGKRENTNTNTPSPERANPERAREKKKRTDDGPNTDQRSGGRTEAPDTTYKARAKPTSAREGPKPDLTRVHKKMHPSTSAKIRVQAQRPSNFKSKPSGRLKWSTLELVHNWTSPDPPKESDHTWKACPEAWTLACCNIPSWSLTRAKLRRFLKATHRHPELAPKERPVVQKMAIAQKRPIVWPATSNRVNIEKMDDCFTLLKRITRWKV